jgi:hypothetical protein
LVQQRALGRGDDEVYRETALSDPLHQIQDHPFGAAAVE